jgi:predicted HD phosphohydrolase
VKLLHLARRFFGSLSRREPAAADEAWVRSLLNPEEHALWTRMPAADRRHAVGVARTVPAELAPAALLHDVGKITSGLGTFGRVGATVLGWIGRDRWRGRVGDYLRHDALGAELLQAAGSDALTVAWAREHHLPASRWTVAAEAGAALKAADDD